MSVCLRNLIFFVFFYYSFDLHENLNLHSRHGAVSRYSSALVDIIRCYFTIRQSECMLSYNSKKAHVMRHSMLNKAYSVSLAYGFVLR